MNGAMAAMNLKSQGQGSEAFTAHWARRAKFQATFLVYTDLKVFTDPKVGQAFCSFL